MKGSYDILISKLDQFARKYYLNKILKGSLVLVAIFLTLFIVFNVLEFNLYLAKTPRKIIFYTFILGLLAFSVAYIFIPALQYFKLGKRIDEESSAKLIGTHFQEVEDKLLNILQLKSQADENQSDLLMAGIEQKAEEIKVVPFQNAIDLRKNMRYARYALIPLLMLLVLWVRFPELISESTYRFVNNNKEFLPEAPFDFVFEEKGEHYFQFQNVPVHLKIEGEKIPMDAQIVVNGVQYRMRPDAETGSFTYMINNIQDNTNISFEAGGFSSHNHTLNVVKRPEIHDFEIFLDYPAYTKKPDEKIENIGDILAPVGTKATWKLKAANIDYFEVNPWEDIEIQENDLAYEFSKGLYQNERYGFKFGRKAYGFADSVSYHINAIPDLFPSISVEQFEDENTSTKFYAGEVADDYGVAQAYFVKEIYDSNNRRIVKDSVSILDRLQEGTFEYQFDDSKLNLDFGQSGNIFFVVYDNDGIHGSKRSVSTIFTTRKESVEELEELEENTEEEILRKAEELKKRQEQIRKSAEELRQELMQEKDIDWKAEKKLEEMQNEQSEIKKEAQQLQEQFQEQKQKEEQYKSEKSEKQEQEEEALEKMLENVQDKKMEELLQKIQELMQKKQKDDAVNELNQLQQESQQEEMDYERLLELYKKLEVETDLLDQIDKLEELAKRQDELSKENAQDEQKQDEQKQDEEGKNQENDEQNQNSDQENQQKENGDQNQKQNEGDQQEDGQKPKSEEEKQKEQEKIKEEFNKIQEKIEEALKKNEELKAPMTLPDTKPDAQEINMEMNESMKQQNSPQQKSQNQKNAAQKMQEMAQKMQSAMSDSQEEAMQEDIRMIRQLLENLVNFSFDQEDVFNFTNRFQSLSPEYKNLVRQQSKLKQDWLHMKDSLVEISLRQAMIAEYINEKIAEIDNSFGLLVDLLEDRQQAQATVHERRIMTNINDLALMMDESLQNLQQQMSQGNPSAMCNKPNPNGPPKSGGQMPQPGKMSEGQQQLNEDMMKMHEEIMRKMKEGQQMGQGQPKEGDAGSSQKFAEMAARQAALRHMLEQKAKEEQQRGNKNEQLEQLGREMDKLEFELVNKRLTSEMLKRQQNILSKMLDYEKAERNQEWDEKRKSETAEYIEPVKPDSLLEYLNERKSQKIEYKTIPAELKPFYQRLVNGYFEKIKDTE